MIRAVLGGTFDPFHIGHQTLVQYILQHSFADQVHVIPVGQSPHKQQPVESGRHRLKMIEIALGSQDMITIDSREIDRGGISFTVDTVKELYQEYPHDRWRLVIGSDNVEEFFSWREPERLLDMAEILIFARDGWQGKLPLRIVDRAQLVLDFACPISSTHVREKLASGRIPAESLARGVADYIADNALYKPNK